MEKNHVAPVGIGGLSTSHVVFPRGGPFGRFHCLRPQSGVKGRLGSWVVGKFRFGLWQVWMLIESLLLSGTHLPKGPGNKRLTFWDLF